MAVRVTDDGEYRRGLVLGLTLAEMLILLLFLVLFALALRLTHELTEKAELNAQLVEAREESATFNSMNATFKPLLDELKGKNELEIGGVSDLVRRLTSVKKLESDIASLRDANSKLASDVALLNSLGPNAIDRLREFGPLLSAAAKINPNDPPETLRKGLAAIDRFGTLNSAENYSKLSSALRKLDPDLDASVGKFEEITENAARLDKNDVAENLKRSVELAEKLGAHDPETFASALQSAGDINKTRAAMVAVEGERDRFRRERDNLIRGGRGLVFPSCWITKSGDTEYIFDVTLHDGGLTVADLASETRKAEDAWKLVSEFPRNSIIQSRTFNDATAKVFAWSKSHECRFVVKLRDGTGAQSKERYKDLRRVVEGHFYIKVEPLLSPHLPTEVADDDLPPLPAIPRRPKAVTANPY